MNKSRIRYRVRLSFCCGGWENRRLRRELWYVPLPDQLCAAFSALRQGKRRWISLREEAVAAATDEVVSCKFCEQTNSGFSLPCWSVELFEGFPVPENPSKALCLVFGASPGGGFFFLGDVFSVGLPPAARTLPLTREGPQALSTPFFPPRQVVSRVMFFTHLRLP